MGSVLQKGSQQQPDPLQHHCACENWIQKLTRHCSPEIPTLEEVEKFCLFCMCELICAYKFCCKHGANQMLLMNAPFPSLWLAFQPHWILIAMPQYSWKQLQKRVHCPCPHSKQKMLSQKETPWHRGQKWLPVMPINILGKMGWDLPSGTLTKMALQYERTAGLLYAE